MKVQGYVVSALAAAAEATQHPRYRGAAGSPTLVPTALNAPREAIQTSTANLPPTPAETLRVIPAPLIKARSVAGNNQTIDASKPMLGLYPEDQVTTETTTFENGIDSSKWIVDTRLYGGADNTPFMRQMETQNVETKDGNLVLKVPGGQTYDANSQKGLSSAQIMSTIMFSVGSLEMKVKMGTEEGTCQCGFLYGADNNEVDMEYLTRTDVNWAVVQGMAKDKPIQQTPLNVTTSQSDDFHTYKLVRTDSKAYYLFDGQLVNVFDKNIPTDPVQVMVAHWTDANPGWTGGPPAKDAIMQVQKIVVEYVGETKTFTTSTAVPSPTGTSAGKNAGIRTYGSTAGLIPAIALLCFYLAF